MQLGRSESGASEVAATPRRQDLRSDPTPKQRQAYLQAVERHYARIYAFLFHMAQNTALAEDLTQETFAIAWQNLERFEGRSSLHVWLHRIALNAFRGHLRSRTPESVPIDDETLTVPCSTPTAIERLTAEELRLRAQQAVAALPVIYREVIVLHCYQGLKYREIAELLRLPLGTVQARSHVAFEKLRKEFGEVDLND